MMTNYKLKVSLFYIVLFCIFMVGVGQYLYATHWGIGLFGSDSFQYVATARNLAHGNGYYYPLNDKRLTPLTFFAPLLPSLLALFELTGLDILISARYFYSILYGLSGLLFILLIYKTTRSFFFALFGGLLFVSSPNFIKVFSVVMSEGPFILLTLTGFLLFNQYIQENRYYLVVILGLILGATVLDRYIGIANVLTILVALLLLQKGLSRKLIDGATIAFWGIFPISIWTLRNYLLTEKINHRLIGFHPPVLKNYLAIYRGFVTWFLPEKYIVGFEKLQLIFILFIGSAALVCFVIYVNKKYGSSSYGPRLFLGLHPLIILFSSYIFIYIGVLLCAKTFFEPNIGFEDRIISPILISILFLVTTLLFYLWNSRSYLIKAVVIIILVYVSVFSFSQSIATINNYHQNGIGLAKKEMQSSIALDTLRELAITQTIYSNNFYISYFHTGRVGYHLNDFSLEHDDKNKVVIAIYGSPGGETFVHKYEDQLELVTSDEVASIYHFKSEP